MAINKDLYGAIPPDVAVCPHCQGQLWIEVDEWDSESRIPTEAGVHVSCENEPDSDPNDVHFQMPYVYWLPITKRVHEWIVANDIQVPR